ncbi:MAG: mechanosensitive ion channel family protein [Sulfolobales archaeon]
MRRVVYIAIIAIIISYIIYNIKDIINRVAPQIEIPENITIALKAVAVALAIIWVVTAIASTIRERLSPIMGNKVYHISSLIKITGYIIAIIAAIGIAGADLSGLLAGGVVTGLVLGIALQPVLSNFFAGLLIMATRMVEVGSRARILSTSIPFSPAVLPAYKYFSADFIEAGFKGTIVDINFFYTRMVTDEGRKIKIPNIVLMNSTIIDYTPEFSKREVINLRVEMPLANTDLELLEDMIREALKGFQIEAGPYFNEQSDKDHVIVMIKLAVPAGEDWRRVKSEALKRLLILRKRIIEASTLQRSAVQS